MSSKLIDIGEEMRAIVFWAAAGRKGFPYKFVRLPAAFW
jgi:hypothetical protein